MSDFNTQQERDIMIYRNLQQIHFQVMRFSNPHSVGHKSHPKNQRWMRWMRLVENSSIGCIPDCQIPNLVSLVSPNEWQIICRWFQKPPLITIFNSYVSHYQEWRGFPWDIMEICHAKPPFTIDGFMLMTPENGVTYAYDLIPARLPGDGSGIQLPCRGATGDMCHLGPEHAAKK